MAATVPLKGNFAGLIFKAQSNLLVQFVDKNHHTILALMALFCLWLLARAYTIEQKRKHEKLSTEDIALLKIIKDNATRIWNHHHPGKKVIRLEDCKE